MKQGEQSQAGPVGDGMIRALGGDSRVRLMAIRSTDMVEKARALHDLFPTPCAALGRLLTGAALMSSSLKNPDNSLTLQIRSDGPLGGMVVVSDGLANVRGHVYRGDFDLPLNNKGKLDVGGAVGRGMLHVIKDYGLKEPYVGSVALQTGEIAEDLTWYHASSEQTPTVMTLGVLVGVDGKVLQAGGLMVQLMPDAGEELITSLEDIAGNLPPITTLLAEGSTPEQIIEQQFASLNPQIMDRRPVSYHCPCSTERMERNLISLGRKELEELSEDPDGIELQCHFCSRNYHFSMAAVHDLTERATRP